MRIIKQNRLSPCSCVYFIRFFFVGFHQTKTRRVQLHAQVFATRYILACTRNRRLSGMALRALVFVYVCLLRMCLYMFFFQFFFFKFAFCSRKSKLFLAFIDAMLQCDEQDSFAINKIYTEFFSPVS